ncbi:MAG: segregation/condensation protein A, partial [Anaerotignum sp.]|nr:segregation/condensation protein A [Anaerotignum sp.]
REREEDAALVFYKEADASVEKLKEKEPQELDELLQGITLDDLHAAFLQVMARQETKVDRVRSSFRSVQRDMFTVSEKMEYIRDLLILRPHGTTAFHTIFRENAGKMEKVVTFLALLELIKQKEVQIMQEKNFGEILISKYKEGGTA